MGPEPLSQGCPNLVYEGGGPAGSPQAENAPSTAEGWQVKASSGQPLAERREMVESQREEFLLSTSASFSSTPPPNGSLLSLALGRLLPISELYWAFASAVPAG